MQCGDRLDNEKAIIFLEKPPDITSISVTLMQCTRKQHNYCTYYLQLAIECPFSTFPHSFKRFTFNFVADLTIFSIFV